MKRFFLFLLPGLLLAACAMAATVYGPTVFMGDVSVGTWPAIGTSTVSFATTSGGAYTNAEIYTNFYRISGTNRAGRLPVSEMMTYSFTGDGATSAVYVSWTRYDGLSGYVIERSYDGATWTNWLSAGSGNCTNWTDLRTNVYLSTVYTSLYTEISAPTVPWGGTNDVSDLTDATNHIRELLAPCVVTNDSRVVALTNTLQAGRLTLTGTADAGNQCITNVDDLHVSDIYDHSGVAQIGLDCHGAHTTNLWEDWNAELLNGQPDSFYRDGANITNNQTLAEVLAQGNDAGNQTITNLAGIAHIRGDVTFVGTSVVGFVGMESADSVLGLCGGTHATNGAYVSLNGNEWTSGEGAINLYAGNTNSGAANSGSINLWTHATKRLQLKYSGLFDFQGNTLSNAVFMGDFDGDFDGDAGGATNLNASALASGTVPDARIDAGITRDAEWDTFSEINAASTDTDAVTTNQIGSTVQAYDADLSKLALNDSGSLTNLNASALASGTVPNARLDTDLQPLALDDGGGLTNVNAATLETQPASYYRNAANITNTVMFVLTQEADRVMIDSSGGFSPATPKSAALTVLGGTDAALYIEGISAAGLYVGACDNHAIVFEASGALTGLYSYAAEGAKVGFLRGTDTTVLELEIDAGAEALKVVGLAVDTTGIVVNASGKAIVVESGLSDFGGNTISNAVFKGDFDGDFDGDGGGLTNITADGGTIITNQFWVYENTTNVIPNGTWTSPNWTTAFYDNESVVNLTSDVITWGGVGWCMVTGSARVQNVADGITIFSANYQGASVVQQSACFVVGAASSPNIPFDFRFYNSNATNTWSIVLWHNDSDGGAEWLGNTLSSTTWMSRWREE